MTPDDISKLLAASENLVGGNGPKSAALAAMGGNQKHSYYSEKYAVELMLLIDRWNAASPPRRPAIIRSVTMGDRKPKTIKMQFDMSRVWIQDHLEFGTPLQRETVCGLVVREMAEAVEITYSAGRFSTSLADAMEFIDTSDTVNIRQEFIKWIAAAPHEEGEKFDRKGLVLSDDDRTFVLTQMSVLNSNPAGRDYLVHVTAAVIFIVKKFEPYATKL
ncbi:hypothetical protein CCP2SC5_740014 [Azospirillaceae bacterium]